MVTTGSAEKDGDYNVKKRKNGGPADLTVYESVVYWYLSFSKNYSWTPKQIDDQELDMLLDYVVVSHKTSEDNNERVVCIDEVM